MIPVALPPCVAGDGLTRSLFILRIHSTVHCVSYLTGINSCDEPSQEADFKNNKQQTIKQFFLDQ